MQASSSKRHRFFAVLYSIQFSDTMAYGSHHFLTNFRFQCDARERLLFGSPYFASARGKGELDRIKLLTVDGYTRNFSPASLGEELAILLSLEELGKTNVRFCFRVINGRGRPVTAGYQTVVAADSAGGEPTLWPEGLRALLGELEDLAESGPFTTRLHAGLKDALFSPELCDLGARLVARQRPGAAGQIGAPGPLPSNGALVESRSHGPDTRVCLFGGQGTLSLETFAALAAHRDIAALDAICSAELGASIRGLLGEDREGALRADPELDQAAIFLTSVWLAETLPESPTVLVGHSFGEIAALCVAGAFDVAAGLRIVCRRARALKAYGGAGALAAISGSEEDVRNLLALSPSHEVQVVGVNRADQTIVAADPSALEELAAACTGSLKLSRISSRYAFHTPRLTRASAQFLAALDDIPVVTPTREVYSPIHDDYYDRCSGEEIKTRLAAQMVTPFHFLRAIQRLFAEGCRRFVECSGKTVVVSSLLNTFGDKVQVSGVARPPLRTGAQSADRNAERPAMGEEVAAGEAYAIVGYGCVLPGAANPDELRELLHDGRSGIVDMRTIDARYADFSGRGQGGVPTTYSTLAGRVDDAALSPGGAPTGSGYDRTQRLLAVALSQCAPRVKARPGRVRCLLGATADGSEAFDLAWLACDLERAGITGVIDADEPAARAPSRALSAAVTDVLGAGIQTTLLDAACASSLFATVLGMRLLAEHQADVVVAGGVFSPGPGNNCLFAQFRGLSDTASRPFDRDASGVIFGEGAAVIVLKRLADALRDADPIAAVVRGAGLSSDGHSPSANVPRKAGQVIAMRRAYEHSGIAPATVQFVEAHGTATPKGDETELESVSEIFSGRTAPLWLGSVKAQIGHTGWAAGTASIIKLCLALQGRFLPKQHNFSRPSPALAARHGLLDVVHAEAPWPANSALPRRAATSGFGFGGTNAHVVVEEFVPAYHQRWRAASALPRVERLAVVAIEALRPADGVRFSSGDCRLPDELRLLPDLVENLDRGQLLALRLVHGMIPRLRSVHQDVAVLFSAPDKSELGRQVQLHIYRDHLVRVAAARGRQIGPALERARASAPAAGPYTLQGMMQNVVAGRVANVFDLQGPNFTVDSGARGLGDALALAPLLIGMGTKIVVVGMLELGEQAAAREAGVAVALCEPEQAAALGLEARAFLHFDSTRGAASLDAAAFTQALARAGEGQVTRLEGGIVVEGRRLQDAGFKRSSIARYTPTLVQRHGRATLERSKRVLVLARSLTDSLASALREWDAEVHVIAPEVLDADRAATLAADAVLCLAPIVAAESSVLHAVEHARPLFEAHAAALRVLYPRLGAMRVMALLEGGVATVGGTPRLHPITGLYSGLLKSLARETGASSCRAVVFTDAAEPTAVLEELCTPGVLEVVYHAGSRHERVLTEAQLDPADDRLQLDADKVVLLTGGARGVTAVCAEALLSRYGCRLVLCGRSPTAVESRWLAYDDEDLLERDFYAEVRTQHQTESMRSLKARFERLRASREVVRTLERLQTIGDCSYEVTDITSARDTRRLFDSIAERYGRLDLIVHGAGVQLSKRYDKREPSEIAQTLDVKLRGLMHLVEEAERFDPPVALHVLTSAFSYFGNDGQADYGAANEALDRTCAWLARPDRSCVSVGWLAWNQIGMTRRAEYRLLGATRGLRGIDADEGRALFLDMLTANDPIQVLMSADERRLYGIEVSSGELMTLDENVDRYVTQHRVGGVPTMPGAFLLDRVLTKLLETDGALARASWIDISDIRFHRFIKVNRPQTLRLRRCGYGRVQVIGDVVHQSGLVLKPDQVFAEMAVRPGEPRKAQLVAPHIGATMADRYVEPGAPIALSGPFDCLRDIVLGSSVRSASYRPVAGEVRGLGEGFPALAVDAAWRLYLISPLYAARHVPLRVDCLSIHRTLAHASPHRILTAAPRVSDDTISCDRFEVTSAEGQLMLVGQGCLAADLHANVM